MNTISKKEAIFLVVIITVAQIILDVASYIVEVTGTGTIINIIYIGIIGGIFCFIFYKLLKNFPNSDIVDVSGFLGGKALKLIVSALFILFLFLTSLNAISNFAYLLRSVYFTNFSNSFIILFFILAILIPNLRGFNAIKRLVCTFVPLAIISIISLCLGTANMFDINKLSPIFGYNFKTTFGLNNIFILNFLPLFCFLSPILRKKEDLKPIMFISLAINIVLIILTVIGIFSIFPTLVSNSLANSNNLSTTYLIVRETKINDFLQNIDIIFMLTWLFSIFSYISFFIYGITFILNKFFLQKSKSKITIPVCLLLAIPCILLNKYANIQILQKDILKIYSIILTFVICPLILILANIKRRLLKNAKKV